MTKVRILSDPPIKKNCPGSSARLDRLISNQNIAGSNPVRGIIVTYEMDQTVMIREVAFYESGFVYEFEFVLFFTKTWSRKSNQEIK